jgi:hypothetical protein
MTEDRLLEGLYVVAYVEVVIVEPMLEIVVTVAVVLELDKVEEVLDCSVIVAE